MFSQRLLSIFFSEVPKIATPIGGIASLWWLAYKYTRPLFGEETKAIAVLKGEKGFENISGVVKFSKISEGMIRIEAEVSGLKKGKHGIHIHAYGDLTKGCESAGAHFNPYNKYHGGPLDVERHVGDLGNIISEGEHTESTLTIEDKLIKLEGDTSVVGRSIVIHADEDDLGRGLHLDSLTVGHSGARVACGVIGIGH